MYVFTEIGYIRDVTSEVNLALYDMSSYAYSRRPVSICIIRERSPDLDVDAFLVAYQLVDNLLWLRSQFNHEAPWEETIGTVVPGTFDTSILFRDQIMTLEDLGNWTYGYIGVNHIIASEFEEIIEPLQPLIWAWLKSCSDDKLSKLLPTKINDMPPKFDPISVLVN